MIILNITELKAEIANLKGTEEYTELVNEFVNDTSVKSYLETESGKKLLQPIVDSNFTKGLETWKTNNLDKIVNAKIKELNPEKDEKDIRINDLAKQLEEMKRTANREKMLNYAVSLANSKGLPTEIVSYFLAEDEDTTKENLLQLEKVFSAAVSNNVDNKLKNQYIPPIGDDEDIDPIVAEFQSRNPNIKVKV